MASARSAGKANSSVRNRKGGKAKQVAKEVAQVEDTRDGVRKKLEGDVPGAPIVWTFKLRCRYVYRVCWGCRSGRRGLPSSERVGCSRFHSAASNSTGTGLGFCLARLLARERTSPLSRTMSGKVRICPRRAFLRPCVCSHYDAFRYFQCSSFSSGWRCLSSDSI